MKKKKKKCFIHRLFAKPETKKDEVEKTDDQENISKLVHRKHFK